MAERLAKPLIDRELYPSLHEIETRQEGIRTAIASELTEKLPAPKIDEEAVTARDSGDSGEVISMQLAK